MVNEDIITSLKNAIEKGETIEVAIATAVNSGYNPREVEEAAKFIGGGVISMEKISKEQVLAMPNERNFFSKLFNPKKTQTFVPIKDSNMMQNATQPMPQQKNQLFSPNQADFYNKETNSTKKSAAQSVFPISKVQNNNPQETKQQQIKLLPEIQTVQQIKQNITIPQPQKIEPPSPLKLKPKRQSYLKEIILLIILLVLIAILIITFKFRDQIILFFSG